MTGSSPLLPRSIQAFRGSSQVSRTFVWRLVLIWMPHIGELDGAGPGLLVYFAPPAVWAVGRWRAMRLPEPPWQYPSGFHQRTRQLWQLPSAPATPGPSVELVNCGVMQKPVQTMRCAQSQVIEVAQIFFPLGLGLGIQTPDFC